MLGLRERTKLLDERDRKVAAKGITEALRTIHNASQSLDKTMSTHPLFDKVFSGPRAPSSTPLTGEELKESGMRSVFRHTPDWYREAFRSAVETFPRGKTFTVEDVREIAGDPPVDEVSSSCMGSLMIMVAKMKLAKKTGYYVKAKRPNMNATDLACWVRI
jgi:hypothetical protein